jgi:hypothetical protein
MAALAGIIVQYMVSDWPYLNLYYSHYNNLMSRCNYEFKLKPGNQHWDIRRFNVQVVCGRAGGESGTNKEVFYSEGKALPPTYPFHFYSAQKIKCSI